jgi:hypothetical protein
MEESSSGEERALFSTAIAVTLVEGDLAASSPPVSRDESGKHCSRSARVLGPSGATTASAVIFAALGAVV